MSSHRIVGAKRAVFLYVEEFVTGHGYPPTVRQIAAGLGYSSPATVQAHLDGLRQMGYIEGEGRTLKIIDKEKSNA
jgi:repressor LexA